MRIKFKVSKFDMKKRWNHPLFKPSTATSRELLMFTKGRNYFPRSSGRPDIAPAISLAYATSTSGNFGKETIPNGLFRNRIATFFFTIAVALVFSVLGFLTKAKLSNNLTIASVDFPTFQVSAGYEAIDKEVFLSRLSEQGRRQIASQTHYVAELMKGSRLSKSEAKKLAFTIVAESSRASVDPLFVTAVIKAESTFNRHAVSYAGALGLMQIMPNTGKFVSRLKNVEWKGSWKLHEPEYNIKLGIAYLKHLEDAFDGNKELMLMAYNWGPANVVDALRKSSKRVPRSTVKYARSIISNHSRWNSDFTRNMAQFKYLDIEFLS